MVEPLLELRRIEKAFSGVRALKGVDFTLRNEVHALVGENGAGKSTLMKIVSGVYDHKSFDGEILVRGRLRKFLSPEDARLTGIAIIHQELSFFSPLSVAENLFVGEWPTFKSSSPQARENGNAGHSFLRQPAPWKKISWSKMIAEAHVALSRVGLQDLDPLTPMNELSVGNQQLVEIAKVVKRNADIIIFDEPTSALAGREIEKLFSVILDLKAQKKGIIYISHKLEEVDTLSDRVTVLRDGASVMTQDRKANPKSHESTRAELIEAMVGRTLTQQFPERIGVDKSSETLFDFNGIKCVHSLDKSRTIGPIDFSIKKGEIFGLAGLLGSGRTEFFEALMGSSKLKANTYKIDFNHPLASNIRRGKRLGQSPKESLHAGLSMLHEDRRRSGLLTKRNLTENSSISRHMLLGLSKLSKSASDEAIAKDGLKRFRTKYASLAQEIQTLSGGNQQKVLLERALQTKPKLLILDEPTRGVDVGARYEIYEILFGLVKDGLSILVSSSDLGELIGLCDRIGVFSRGRMTGILEKPDFNQETIMKRAVEI